MRRLLTILTAVTLAGMPVVLAQQAMDLDALFARAERQETIAADLAGAIATYAQLIEAAGPTNALTPRAILRLAECHRKLGHDEARGLYAAIVRNYPNSGEPYETARVRLAAMQASSNPFQSATFELPNGRLDNWEVSPDGRSIVWLRRGGSAPAPDSELLLRDIATGADRTLASHLHGLTARVTFSPDGTRVAAIIGTSGRPATRPYRQLAVAGTRTDAAPPLVKEASARFEDAHVHWSPDGRWLAYLAPSTQEGRSDVSLLDIRTGESTSLGVTVDRRPDLRWMPSDGRLVFRVGDVAEPGRIHLVSPATMAHEVVDAPAEITGPMRIRGATPDGRLVLLRTDVAVANVPGRPVTSTLGLFDPVSRAFIVTCQGSPPQQGEDGSRDQCLDMTPDGTRQLLWTAGTQQLVIRDIATGVERPLTVGGGEEHLGMLGPDGQVVVFVSNRDGRWAMYAAAVDEAPVSQPVKLGDLEGVPRSLQTHWTDRGLVLGFQSGTANLFRVNMNADTGRSTGPIVRLTQDHQWNNAPAISPDGSRIAYWVTQGQSGLAVMNADGSNERLVTPRQFGYARYLAWRSGGSVLFTSMIADGNPARLSIDTASGAISPVQVPLFENPAWQNPMSNWELRQPTGEVIYAWADDPQGPFEFRARSITTGVERTVVKVGTTGCSLDNFAMAPDGKTMAYQLGPCTQPGKVSTIGIADLDTGATRTIIEPADGIDLGGLSSNGRYFAYVITDQDADLRPWIMNLATQERWPLVSEGQQPWLWIPLVKFAPDGSYLVFVQGHTGREWKQWTDLSYEAIKSASQK